MSETMAASCGGQVYVMTPDPANMDPNNGGIWCVGYYTRCSLVH
jgi:hypothetical protein